MNKKLLMLLIILLLPSALLADDWGDVNGDGKTNNVDVVELYHRGTVPM